MPKRTTLTLDDDVVDRLAAEARRSGRSFKTVVNEALRAGLERPRRRAAFRIKARRIGFRGDLDLDDISGTIERLEGPLHR